MKYIWNFWVQHPASGEEDRGSTFHRELLLLTSAYISVKNTDNYPIRFFACSVHIGPITLQA